MYWPLLNVTRLNCHLFCGFEIFNCCEVYQTEKKNNSRVSARLNTYVFRTFQMGLPARQTKGSSTLCLDLFFISPSLCSFEAAFCSCLGIHLAFLPHHRKFKWGNGCDMFSLYHRMSLTVTHTDTLSTVQFCSSFTTQLDKYHSHVQQRDKWWGTFFKKNYRVHICLVS